MRTEEVAVYFNSYDSARQFALASAGRFRRAISYGRNGTGGFAKAPRSGFTDSHKQEFKERWRQFIVSASQNKFELTAFSATFLSLTATNGHQLGFEISPLVLEALHRSNPATSELSTEQLSEYLGSLSPEQLQGVINSTKGVYHELKFVERENSDFDSWHAELMPDVNNPGADVVLSNLETGEVIEVQLKATDSLGYIGEHLSRYADISVMATSEVANRSSDAVASTGFSNEELTMEVEQTLRSSASDSGSDIASDAITDGLFGGGLYTAIGAAGMIADKGWGVLDDPRSRDKLVGLVRRGVLMSIGVGFFV